MKNILALSTPMKFMVRYWSSLIPDNYREDDGSPCWVDYSLHPASKLGLHNALLAVHDRLDILQAHGGDYECAVFVLEGGGIEMLTQENASALFSVLPRGEVKWLDIRDFLLPLRPDDSSSIEESGGLPIAEQLPLFEHVHTPYDDLEARPHILDVDV
ncbi:hypothetical protein [Propionivibrio sp.]|uniref:hypothetical protein n=1 Tax=Propionivibrio sp. TaxID=2212460 RepID=UPI003BF2427E